MIALVDADVVCYRSAWASENETDEAIACVRANKTCEDILARVGATSYKMYLSDSLANNYRLKFDPLYKISRQSMPKPKWYWSVKTFLQKNWNAEVSLGQEADDALGIAQETLGTTTIICSNDKDLLQVPGLHYRFVQKEFVTQSYLGGLKSFYSQFLIGDRVDDIKGVNGLGPVKTEALLGNCTNELELFERVRNQYKNDARLLSNGRLLWVRREPDQIWEFPHQESTNQREETNVQDEGRISSDSTN